jgi:hypothetical protein
MRKLMTGVSKVNILYVGRKVDTCDGGGIVANRNLEVLEASEKVSEVFKVFVDCKSKIRKLINLTTFRPLGFCKDVLKSIEFHVENSNIDFVFIEHSLLGGFAKILKKKYGLRVITFFQNVEFDYYNQKLQFEGFVNYPMVVWAKQNEQDVAKYSDYTIALTRRDSIRLRELYGIDTDCILPITLCDDFNSDHTYSNISNFHLFIGSAFYANIEGICWYIEKVLPQIGSQLVVIGKNMDFLKKKYPHMKNLVVLGYVKDIADYYLKADFVINPVFSGSGMKTKTIEALKFGKTIVGTAEAFIGIEQDLCEIGFTCCQPSDFISAIKVIEDDIDSYKYNGLARNLFLQEYSNKSGLEKLEKFLGEINE